MIPYSLILVAALAPPPQSPPQDSGFESALLRPPVVDTARPMDAVRVSVATHDLAAYDAAGHSFARSLQISSESRDFIARVEAQEKDAKAGETQGAIAPADRGKGTLDPTMREIYVGTRLEFAQLPNKANRDKLFVVGQGFVAMDEEKAFQGNVQAPVVAHFTGGDTGLPSHWGTSDLIVSGSFLYQQTKEFGHAFGLNAQFNTSSADELGDNSFLLEPFYAISLRELDTLRYVGIVSYKFSVTHENGVPYTSQLIFRPRAICDLPDYNYAALEVGLALDFNRVNDTRGIDTTIRAELGRFFLEKRNLQVFIRFEAPVDRYTRYFVEEFVFSAGLNFFP